MQFSALPVYFMEKFFLQHDNAIIVVTNSITAIAFGTFQQLSGYKIQSKATKKYTESKTSNSYTD